MQLPAGPAGSLPDSHLPGFPLPGDLGTKVTTAGEQPPEALSPCRAQVRRAVDPDSGACLPVSHQQGKVQACGPGRTGTSGRPRKGKRVGGRPPGGAVPTGLPRSPLQCPPSVPGLPTCPRCPLLQGAGGCSGGYRAADVACTRCAAGFAWHLAVRPGGLPQPLWASVSSAERRLGRHCHGGA